MVKGGTLKDDADWKQLGIKDGHKFMMIGSAESEIPKEPEQKTQFVEDMSADQAQVGRSVHFLSSISLFIFSINLKSILYIFLVFW